MKLSFEIKELLKQKSGKALTSPADCDYIAIDIFSVTNEHIGVNTLKRLLGFLNEECNARISTLNIIAKYLGYPDWEALSKADVSNSTFDNASEDLIVKNPKSSRKNNQSKTFNVSPIHIDGFHHF